MRRRWRLRICSLLGWVGCWRWLFWKISSRRGFGEEGIFHLEIGWKSEGLGLLIERILQLGDGRRDSAESLDCLCSRSPSWR